MKILYTITILLLAVLTGSAQKEKTVNINGKISGYIKKHNYIFYYTGNRQKDSVVIKNGKFVIEVPFAEPYIQFLIAKIEKEVKNSYQSFPLFIDGSNNINIELDIEKGYSGTKISGSKSAVDYYDFFTKKEETYKKINEVLNTLYGNENVTTKDTLSVKINTSRDSLSKLYMGATINEFVAAHRNEYVGVYILKNTGMSFMSINMLDQSLQILSADMQHTKEGELIAAYIRGVRNTTIGATVKNFVLNNTERKPISFDQFKGKYVWIDFWASWCGPCKQAFPHMKEIYALYKDKGLEILGISTDQKIDPWLKILPTLQNPWPQVWDDKNIMLEFAVKALPTSFLIDPEGRIVLKEVGYEPNGKSAMDMKLAELFGTKTASSESGTKKENTN